VEIAGHLLALPFPRRLRSVVNFPQRIEIVSHPCDTLVEAPVETNPLDPAELLAHARRPQRLAGRYRNERILGRPTLGEGSTVGSSQAALHYGKWAIDIIQDLG